MLTMDGSYWRCLLSGVDRDCLAGQQNSEFRNGARSIQNLGSPGVDDYSTLHCLSCLSSF